MTTEGSEDDPHPDDSGEFPNEHDEANSSADRDARISATTGRTWTPGTHPLHLLSPGAPKFFPTHRYPPPDAPSATLKVAASGWTTSYRPGLTSLLAADANIGMPRSLLPATGFTAIQSLIPKSPATLEIIRDAVADMYDQQWRSAGSQLGSFVTTWFNELDLPDLRAILEALDLRTIPDNLDELGIKEGDLERITGVLHDGIPLFWVPRARIAARLIAAPSSTARRAVIGHELSSIAEDCLATLELVSNSDYMYEADRLRESADLIFTHPAAAQALATTTLDSLMYRIARAKQAVFDLVTSPGGRGKVGHEEETRERLRRDLGKRGSLALAPVRPIYQQFPPRGSEVPRALNKHASFHRVHPFQYSKRNAAIALMLGTSVLLYMSRWFENELRRAQRRAESS